MRAVRGFERSGVLTGIELRRLGQVPSLDRLKRGPVVIVECVENIPCDPCAHSCPRQAITIEGGLTGLPRVDYEKCTGCMLCIARCPGLAIFVVDYGHTRNEALVALPYELVPRPRAGERVSALDRAGKRVCSGRVVKVTDAKSMDRCAVVAFAVPKRYWNTVRGLKLRERQD